MSASRRSKKIKPINPDEQPVICQFIVDSGSPKTHSENPDNSDCKGKKEEGQQGIKTQKINVVTPSQM